MTDTEIRLHVRDLMSQSEVMQDYATTIFGTLFYGGLALNDPEHYDIYSKKKATAVDALKIFRSKFTEDIFFGDYSLLGQLLIGAKGVDGSLKASVYDRKLLAEMPNIIESGAFPDVNNALKLARENGLPADPQDIYFMLRNTFIGHYVQLSMTIIDMDAYMGAVEQYVEEFKRLFVREVSAVVNTITQDGGALVTLHGETVLATTADEAMDFFAEQQAFLASIGKSAGVGGYVYNRKYLEKKKLNTADTEPIMRYGFDEVDKCKKPLRRGHILVVLGAMKGGKTSYVTKQVATLLAEGKNVAIWTTDGKNDEWESGIKTAILSNGLFKGHKIDVDRSDIDSGDIQPGSEEEKYLTALDLAMDSGEFGRLSFFTGVSYAENIKKDLLDHYRTLNAFDVFVMDTPLNMQSLRNNKSKPEYLANGIQNIAHAIRNELPVQACAILTGQLKQETIDQLRLHPEKDMDITAGADTSELVKSADEIVGIFTTKKERDNHMTKLYDVASRHNKPFDTFYAGADLATLRYWSDSTLNT